MTIKNVGNQKHDANEFVVFQMFIPKRNKTTLIQREIYIVDGLSAKKLIGIDIMKIENITIDLATDTMIIGVCQTFQIPIVETTKKNRVNATI